MTTALESKLHVTIVTIHPGIVHKSLCLSPSLLFLIIYDVRCDSSTNGTRVLPPSRHC